MRHEIARRLYGVGASVYVLADRCPHTSIRRFRQYAVSVDGDGIVVSLDGPAGASA